MCSRGSHALCLVKTSHTFRMNNFERRAVRRCDKVFCHDPLPATLDRLDLWRLPPPSGLLALHTKRPHRRLSTVHKMFWIALRRLWSGWKDSLVLVTPRTVVTWHRAGFQLYWSWLSRTKRLGGRKRVNQEIRTLIFRMAARTRLGEHHASTAICSNWASLSRNPQSLDGFASSRKLQIPTSAG